MNATYSIHDLTAPQHLYTNEEIKEIVKNAMKKEKEYKKAIVIEKGKMISPERFLNSKLVNRRWA